MQLRQLRPQLIGVTLNSHRIKNPLQPLGGVEQAATLLIEPARRSEVGDTGLLQCRRQRRPRSVERCRSVGGRGTRGHLHREHTGELEPGRTAERRRPGATCGQGDGFAADSQLEISRGDQLDVSAGPLGGGAGAVDDTCSILDGLHQLSGERDRGEVALSRMQVALMALDGADPADETLGPIPVCESLHGVARSLHADLTGLKSRPCLHRRLIGGHLRCGRCRQRGYRFVGRGLHARDHRGPPVNICA